MQWSNSLAISNVKYDAPTILTHYIFDNTHKLHNFVFPIC